jgi:hypothetical protein
MSGDLERLLTDAAATPTRPVDADALHARAQRARRRDRLVTGLCTLALVAGGTAAVLSAARGDNQVEFGPADAPAGESGPAGWPEDPSRAATDNAEPTEIPGPAEVAAGVGEADWQVLAVGLTTGSLTTGRGRHVVTDQAAMEGLWQTFEMDGDAPVLSTGQGALVVTVAGTCDEAAQVHGLHGILTPDASDVFAAVQFDSGCAELELDGTAIGPPWTLYVIAVPLEVADRVAGPVAVVADVADFDWQVLAVAATPDPMYSYGFVVLDQAGVDSGWQHFDMPGSAPTLPPGQGALIVAVPGTCDSAAQLRAVDGAALRNGDSTADAGGAVYLDARCAEPLRLDPSNPQPRTLYVIAVPLGVASSFDGPAAYIACGGRQDARSVPCVDPKDHAVAVDDPLGLATIGEITWEVLAIGVTPDPSLTGHVATDQAEVDDLWRTLQMPGSAPVLPPERGALFVPVAGSCDQASDVRAIEPFHGPDSAELWAVFHFDPRCAEPRDEAIDNPEPRRLYVLAVRLDAAERFTGAAAEGG